MKKILSFAVPCYNSQEYMRNCIESLLPGGEEIEIIIVDDGSKDNTAAIADEYAEKYPTICRAIHKENGGHGDAVMAGLNAATGVYYKVVDSDDKLALDPYLQMLDVLRRAVLENHKLDLLMGNFVYDKVGVKRKKVMRFTNVFPTNTYFTWKDVGHFKNTQYILMHNVIYRTELLRECDLNLPKHTFYVDNLVLYRPLPKVEVMYYMNVDFYLYFIGREDQSVNESVMVGRIDQQVRVNRQMIDTLNFNKIKEKNCRKYMIAHMSIVITVSSVFSILSKSQVKLQQKKELWKHLKEKEPYVYRKTRYNILGIWMNLPGRFGRWLSVMGYRVIQKIYGFN